MSDHVGNVEVAFAATYAKIPSSSIRITTEPPRTLNLEEAEKSVGFFDFEGNSEFKRRFIIWRAFGANLYLEEYGLDTFLTENSLCICLHGSQIIPGTCIFYADSFLFIYCPTQTAVHRFFLHIPAGFATSMATKSVLGLLYERSNHLREIHDSYELNSQSIALRAHIAHVKLDLYALFFLRDMQLVKLRMNSFPATLPSVEVTHLHSDGILHRMVGSSAPKNVSGIASCIIGNECFFFVLFSNGIVQTYSRHRLDYTKNLMENLIKECVPAQESLTFTAIKIQRFNGLLLLLCHAQNGNNENYVMISRTLISESWKPKSMLNDFRTILVPAVDVVDFLCLLRDGSDRLIVLSRNEFKHSTLLSSGIDWSTGQMGRWEATRGPHIRGAEKDSFVIGNTDAIAAKRLRIYDQNNYSFDVVLRSALLVCKHHSCENQLQKLMPNDWNGLRNIIDFYVASPQFEALSTNRTERKQNRSARVDDCPKLKFWTAFEKSCNELLEANCFPLGIWYSPSTDLYGTLQKGRFTVCIDEDKRMDWLKEFLSLSNQRAFTNEAFDKCLSIANLFTGTQAEILISDEQCKCFVHYFSIVSDMAAEVLKKFVGSCAIELKPKEYSNGYNFVESYGEAFLPGLVSAALRQRIMDRLLFSDAILAVIKIYYATLEKYRSSMLRWESALSACELSLQNINRQYRILLQVLSIRLLNRRTQMELSVGDSFFFDGGLEVIKNFAEAYLDDSIEDRVNNIGREALAGSLSSSITDFLPNIISTAVAVLWPENKDLHLAQYLNRMEQFEALLSFCLLNEPYGPELLHAFQFFKGVAYAGIGQPEDAAQIFSDAYKGMEKQDKALLKAVFPDKGSLGSPSEYFLKVTEIMERHNCSEQIVKTGRLALQKIKAEDPLLAHIYTMLFKHELATSMYADCVQTLLKNPSHDNRKMCLRELIAKLIDSNKRKELINLDYGSMEDYVVEVLEARARSADPADEELLYEILYAFHFCRSNFSRAALSMYEYTNRFRGQVQSCESFTRRCHLLSVVHQTLLLLPVQSRYLTVPNQENVAVLPEVTLTTSLETSGKLHENSVYEMDHKKKFVSSVNLLDEWDISKEFAIEDARLALLDDHVKMQNSSESYCPPLDPQDILCELIEKRLFHRAWVFSRVFQMPPYEVIRALVKECIYHYASGDIKDPIWVSNMDSDIHSASEKDNCSAVLRGYVEAATHAFPSDVEIPRSACDTFLRYRWPIPCWLLSYYEEHFLSDYVNLLLVYGRFEEACTSLIKAVELTMNAVTTKDARVILPYTVIDQLLYLTTKCNDPRLEKEVNRLESRLQQYFNRLDSFSRV